MTFHDEQGALLGAAPLHAQERIILSHMHSVHRSLVEEIWGPGPGDTIAVLEGRYADYGAGLAQSAEPGQRLEFAGGRARLFFEALYLPRIEVRVGRMAGHTLHVRDTALALETLVAPGQVAVFRMYTGVCPRSGTGRRAVFSSP